MPYEIVDDARDAPDSVAAWLALELESVNQQHGTLLFDAGVPCRRRIVRPAVKRQVFMNEQIGGEEVAWGNDISDGVTVAESIVDTEDARIEERVIIPAVYDYQCPRVLGFLSTGLARWAYKNFKAAEFDSMYRLRDNTDWYMYVTELFEGMANR